MPLQNAYTDAYLSPLVTEAREAQAAADVAELGTLPAGWVTRLTVIRAYIITCLESIRQPDDVFTLKLTAYRKDYADALTQARAAQAVVDAEAGGGGGSSFFSVGLERC